MKQFLTPLCFFVFTNLSAQVNLNSGLVAYYPFNGNSLDEGVNGINGTVNSAVLTSDRNNQTNSAFYFNGTSSNISLPYSNLYNFPINGKFTISLWIQPDLNNSWPAQALVVKSPFNNNYQASLWNYGTYMFNYKAMAGFAFNNILIGTTTFNLNQCWYNIIQTYDNGKWNIYVNGVLEASDLSQTKFILQDGPSSRIFFGKKGESNGDYYKGKLDDIRIYDRVVNADEISNLSQQVNACLPNCSNWLKLSSVPSSVKVGDLDISGNQITVEATINRNAFLTPSGFASLDIVSKHNDPSDANYLLRPNSAEITTTNGFFQTPIVCETELNKTYHVALVYDGTTLKFYRNGFLMKQIAATGNLVLNNWQTSIGLYDPQITNTNFLGYINEVRIWDVARTQAQLQTYMNSSLPNPTTQVGLKGYYTFDNLLNKQGNTAFNGTLNGGATINATNPNCNFVADSCAVIPTNPCSKWLATPSLGSRVNIGDLDISGNQLTIEATINRTTSYTGGNLYAGDVVSKHSLPSDVNYLLRPNSAEITTSNGYFITPTICPIDLNKTYHVAMVYDGSTLKFYRNGFLMSQINATGNLFQNDLNTFIGHYSIAVFNTQFIGYTNEVRIWDVARTQAQLQTYMNTSLPNPTTQSGLKAYYTFDNLLNKQGNTAFNGTLNGGATINATNPNCGFVADSCAVIPTNPCSKWLSTPSLGSRVNIGDLDISGNHLTIEATINRTTSYTGGNLYAGDVVSKHSLPSDVNYLLRPNSAEITTSNGYFITPTICPIDLNKTYHVAMVYDGSTLKFYRNGFLMSQINATGNLFQNDLNTFIGHYSIAVFNTQFIGYTNEVRIWDVARTQSQLQTYMNISLPNPTTQAGLKGYYTFDNLFNKQGNTAFNGTLNGGATINATNPNCSFVADSCAVIPIAETIINNYTPVSNLDICKNILTVGNAAAYNVGDTVLLIQMKGAVIDSTNTVAFGNITDYKSAGNYEYNYIKSKTGNTIELKNKILRTYEIPNGKVQLVRVPYYQNYSTTSNLTCLPWDGSIGGVLVFNVANSLTLNNDIDVSGKGFRGAIPSPNSIHPCNEGQFYYASNAQGGEKGEGVADISSSKRFGKGALGNGGGGGNSDNSGGAGGSNAGQGGNGGKQWEGCTINTQNGGGIGGVTLINSSTLNKAFLGGGGGMGHQNDNLGFPAGNGGGIILIKALNINTNNKKISSNGNDAILCTLGSGCTDGASGAGAGGSIVLDIQNYLQPTIIESKGGKGADNFYNDPVSYPGAKLGTGGGGGGGLIGLSQSLINANLQLFLNGGANGVNTAHLNNPHGATPGQAGQTLFNLVLPISNTLFKPNIDSVKISNAKFCATFNFSGLAYTNTSPIVGWQWHFGDNTFGVGQNVVHTYLSTNLFIVKLVVTDINGCKDSTTINIISNSGYVDAGIDKTFCGAQNSVSLIGMSGLSSSSSTTYSWTSTPTTIINNPNTTTPTAIVNTTTMFYFTATHIIGCVEVDSVKVTINPIPTVQTLNDISICKGTTLQLTTTPGLNTYHWSPGIYVSDSTIANPIFSDTIPRTLIVTGSNGLCTAKDTINIGIKPNPIVRTIKDTTICSTQSIDLTTTSGIGTVYSWTPATFLNNTAISNPTFMGNASNTYYVTGTALNGCIAKDTVVVTVNIPNNFLTPPNKSFCKNESVQLDGFNGNSVLYNWQPPLNLSNTSIINPIANPAITTPYTVSITDPVCNVTNNFTVIVTVNPLPNISISKSNDISCNTTSTNLNATGALNYVWNSSAFLNNLNIPNPLASPTNTINFNVTGTDINGCKNSGQITVLVDNSDNFFELPNTFTPNGDLKNDCFGIVRKGSTKSFQFIIYNRWGEKVFETNNINICWNGKYKGELASVGNYVYYIKSTTNCGEIISKGNILLLR